MITMEELNPHDYATNETIKKNLEILLQRMNEVRAAYGKPMVITSGLRDPAHQERLIREGVSNAKHSLHMAGAACDVKDTRGSLKKWCLENEDLLKRIGVWCEHFDYTKTWVHFQILPPKSGKRFFIP